MYRCTYYFVYSCPVPSCKTPKRKVKRLRPFPSKWLELPPEIRDPIISELRKSRKQIL